MPKKARILYESGVFLTDIRYYEYKVNLYMLHNELVEVFYHHKKDIIEKIERMDRNPTRLKFYADKIRIDI
ncbi:MAG: hypothetical protein OEY34_05255 [Cyclobacteriaceae bacterium]|nr:hypothetical protein [Cyclobacteriaceae bacterium]